MNTKKKKEKKQDQAKKVRKKIVSLQTFLK
jgi:hypothetical protein